MFPHLKMIFDVSLCMCVLLLPMCAVLFLCICVCVSAGILLLWSAPTVQWSSRGRNPPVCSIEGQGQEAGVRPTLGQTVRGSETPEAQRPKTIRSDYSGWLEVEWMDRWMADPWKTPVFSFINLFVILHQGKKGVGDASGDAEQKKFDGTGYDSDLVDSLERDIVSRNPNVHWYGSIQYADLT